MSPTGTAAPATYKFISVAEIRPSPHQARKEFDEEGLKSLAESMKQEGQLYPILVRKTSNPAQSADSFELISGERRLRAAKLLGWETIEAKVFQTSGEADAAAKGLVENLQRKDLNPIEEAEGFQTLNQLDPKHWTQERIGQLAGRTQGYVSLSLKMMGLPEEVKKSIRSQILSRSHGLELMRLSNVEQQMEIARKIPGRLTWEETRALVDQLVNKEVPSKPKKTLASIDWEASKGFSFTAHDQWVDVRGTWDREKDMDVFLTELRGALLVWMSQHPYQMKAEPDPATPEGVTESSEQETPKKDGLLASLLQRPKSVYHNPADKRTLSEKISQVTKEFSGKGPVLPRLPANPQEQAELEALAAQGPQAVYAWIYGSDSFFATSMAGATWEKLGHSDPIAGVRDVLAGIKS